jgi:hypothetical protein
MTVKTKKKQLQNLSFDHDQGHIALVGAAVGGAANLQNYAVCLKAGEGFTDEIIEKATKVKVTLSIEEYLTRFYGLYWDDAEVLATALGFTTQASEKETFDYAEDYRKYIDEKVGSIEVMKSLKDKSEFVDVISKMNGEQYIQFLQDQEKLEQVFTQVDAIKQAAKVKPKKSDDGVTLESVTQQKIVGQSSEPTGSLIKKKVDMTKEVKTVVADVEKELVEKSFLVEVQKALDDQKVELTKALELVKQFEREKQEAVIKARKEKLDAVIKSKEQAEVLFKAVGLVEDEQVFGEVIKALNDLQAASNSSDLFKSIGAEGAPETKADTQSDVKKAVQAKIAATKNK